jgi:hypothetical protein
MGVTRSKKIPRKSKGLISPLPGWGLRVRFMPELSRESEKG